MVKGCCRFSNSGLIFPVILICGLTISFFILLCVLFIQHFQIQWSPTINNIEKLVKKRKYNQALALINRADNERNVVFIIEKGKIELLRALEYEHATRWREYGVNENDWFNSDKAKNAEQLFLKAITLKPDNRDAHLYLGILYMKKGWFSLAETEFLSILRINKMDRKARINLGILYTKMDRYLMAEKELLQVYKIAPNEPSIAKNLAVLYRFYLKRPDSAMLWANRYLNMDPKDDLDIAFIRKELTEMLQRYPEYPLNEPMQWKKKGRFKKKGKTEGVKKVFN